MVATVFTGFDLEVIFLASQEPEYELWRHEVPLSLGDRKKNYDLVEAKQKGQQRWSLQEDVKPVSV